MYIGVVSKGMRVGKYKELLLNIALFALNTISTKLITFLLVPLYTYFLTAAQFGITDMSLTVLGLISPIVTLSVGDAVTRYVIDDSRERAVYISRILGYSNWLRGNVGDSAHLGFAPIRRIG